MDAQPRRRASELSRADVPECPGVYAWYRRGRVVYVGEGDDLRDRVWTRHMGQGKSLHTSAFRRNVAESLGLGAANEIFKKANRLTDEQRALVGAWVVSCSVAWIECKSIVAAEKLEDDMKAEWRPPLTKV